jgi:hypothetical protein
LLIFERTVLKVGETVGTIAIEVIYKVEQNADDADMVVCPAWEMPAQNDQLLRLVI